MSFVDHTLYILNATKRTISIPQVLHLFIIKIKKKTTCYLHWQTK